MKERELKLLPACYFRLRPHMLPRHAACCCGGCGGGADEKTIDCVRRFLDCNCDELGSALRGGGGSGGEAGRGGRCGGNVDLGMGNAPGGARGGGGALGATGRGDNSGIGILLRCTVRLDGGVYVFFAGGPSSLIRCGARGCES